jgi:hypothetical protein
LRVLEVEICLQRLDNKIFRVERFIILISFCTYCSEDVL